MTFGVITGLALQATSLCLLFSVLGRSWIRHLGAIFIALACTYHGLTEILGWIFPGYNPYRAYLTSAEVDSFLISISAGILLLTVTYVLSLGREIPTGPTESEKKTTRATVSRAFDWRIMLAITAPLVLWTARGQGVLAPDGYGNVVEAATVQGGLATNFLVIAAPLTATVLLLRFGKVYLIPVFLTMVLAMSLVGQRNEVVVVVVLFAYAASVAGLMFGRRLVIGSLVIVALAGLVLTSTRANSGREAFAADVGVSDKFSAISNGLTGIANKNTREALSMTFGYRLDGNSFGAMELAAINRGQEPLGLAPVKNNILIAVPSLLAPQKLETPIEERLEKLYAQKYLGLPARDILATQLGSTVGYYGLWSLGIASLLIGFILGRLDKWLLSSPLVTPIRLFVGVGSLNALAHYGRGLESWTISGRSVIAIGFALWIWAQITKRSERRRASTVNPSSHPRLSANLTLPSARVENTPH